MPTSYFSTSKEKIKELMKVALGEALADLAIVNGDVVNVFTGEVLKGSTVLIKGDTIAYVGNNAAKSIGSSTQVIDAKGKTLIPGLIDSHTHLDEICLVSELVKYALKGSTTTIITEVSDIGASLGYQGVLEYLKATRNQPVKIFITAPPVSSTSPSTNEFAAIKPLEMRRLLRRSDVIGLGETPWAQVNESNRLLDIIALTINAGKKVDGHGAGARGNKLQAYVATGVSSCHEPITAEEVLERLRLGLLVQIREGSVRRELGTVSQIKDKKIDFSNLAISADGVDPRQLVNDGYMDFIVQKAIDYGFNPVLAIQMVTINIARHYGLDFIGGIAPGKLADIAIIPDLRTIRAEYVIANGKIAVRNNQVVMETREHSYPRPFYNTIRLKHDFSADDFTIHANASGSTKVRVINQVSDLLTKEKIIEMPVIEGLVKMDVSRDILKVAAIDRYWQPGKFALGLIRGFGLKRGAIATTVTWDCGHIIVVGADESDMARAVNRIRELKGGIVICAGGGVLNELPLPVAGLFSEESMETIANKLNDIQRTAEELGTRLPDIRLSLEVLATPSIPFLRICERGLFDLKQNKLVSFFV
jgi:adenine deaminase